jgi:hypothetical protein
MTVYGSPRLAAPSLSEHPQTPGPPHWGFLLRRSLVTFDELEKMEVLVLTLAGEQDPKKFGEHAKALNDLLQTIRRRLDIIRENR